MAGYSSVSHDGGILVLALPISVIGNNFERLYDQSLGMSLLIAFIAFIASIRCLYTP